MAITRANLERMGFHKIKRKHFNTYHYTLIYPINDTDYLFTGYDKITKKTNFKLLWISRILFENERITEPLAQIGDLSYTKVKEFIELLETREKYKKQLLEDAGSYQQD